MRALQEQQRVGLDYLDVVTTLLQRGRGADPIKGLFEAADFQWWWRSARPTDNLGQLFWFDEDGRPESAVILTEWNSHVALDPIFMPDASPELVAHVIECGIAHASESGYDDLDLEVDTTDDVLHKVLTSHGFTTDKASWADGFVESWLAAEARPEISPLPQNYRLFSRLDTTQRPHHYIERSGSDVDQRLLQTSLYRADLDLLVLDSRDNHAAYGLFWFDPETSTGLVEPMRTEDDHQRKGLARHVLTSGIARLVEAGAERIKIIFDPSNVAASGLYLDVGFEPVKTTAVFSRRSG